MLRPREGTYLALGIVVALSLINSVLLMFLWFREPPRAEPRSLAHDGTAAESERERSVSTTEEESTAVGDRPSPGDASDVSEEAGRPGPGEVSESGSQSGVPDVRGLEGGASGPETREAVASESVDVPVDSEREDQSVDAEVTAVPVAPARWPVSPPRELDALSLAAAVEHLPAEPVARARVLFLADRWGSGWVRARARDAIEREAKPFGPALRAVSPIGFGDALPDSLLRDAAMSELFSAESPWEAGLDLSSVPDATAEWVRGTRADLSRPEDCVLLIDLSESMSAEIPMVVGFLRRVIPTMTGFGSGRRWGWIGFRDEVVARFDLTDDGDAFLASLDDWVVEGGGDVPEGVDRALFEALRFESFSWRPQVPRRLLLLGDAPPPYERISGVVTLLGAAHASPEAFGLSALGILREPELHRLPTFARLAKAAEGRSLLVEPNEFGADGLWSWLTGRSRASWSGHFFDRDGQ